MDRYSTREAAQRLGLSMATLNRYVAAKRIPLPALTRVGGVRDRLWSEQDIEKDRQVLPKIQNGRKTQYKKKQPKKKQTKNGGQRAMNEHRECPNQPPPDGACNRRLELH